MTTADTLLPFIVLCSDPRWGACVAELRRLVAQGRELAPAVPAQSARLTKSG